MKKRTDKDRRLKLQESQKRNACVSKQRRLNALVLRPKP